MSAEQTDPDESTWLDHMRQRRRERSGARARRREERSRARRVVLARRRDARRLELAQRLAERRGERRTPGPQATEDAGVRAPALETTDHGAGGLSVGQTSPSSSYDASTQTRDVEHLESEISRLEKALHDETQRRDALARALDELASAAEEMQARAERSELVVEQARAEAARAVEEAAQAKSNADRARAETAQAAHELAALRAEAEEALQQAGGAAGQASRAHAGAFDARAEVHHAAETVDKALALADTARRQGRSSIRDSTARSQTAGESSLGETRDGTGEVLQVSGRAREEGPLFATADERAAIFEAVGDIDRRARAGTAGDRGKVNLRNASFEQLRALGLSITQSKRLLRLRKQGHPGGTIDSLEEVRGLPRALRERLKRHLIT